LARKSRGKLRVFVDANILIRGLTLPRFPYEVLRAGTLGKIHLITSTTTLARAHHYIETKFTAHVERLERFLTTGIIEVIDDPPDAEVQAHMDLVRDEDDVSVALAAIKARAQYLVSTDPDLTVVDKTTEKLRRQVTPIRPGDFLKGLLGWTSKELSRIEKRTWQELETEGDEQD
jgi:putative PIN family toxin of toxin-antitoxin system